jgi:hypothetical protein
MKVLVCSVDATPCPPESQTWLSVDEAFTPGALGVDSSTVLEVFSFGFGAVVFFWFLGYGIGAALKVIRMA